MIYAGNISGFHIISDPICPLGTKKMPLVEGILLCSETMLIYYGPGVQVGWQGQSGSSNGHLGVQVGTGDGV